MRNIQCQLAVSAVATELAPIVQGMQFCYIGKIPKSYVLFRISALVFSYITKLECIHLHILCILVVDSYIKLIRTRKLLLLIFTCNYDFHLY